MSVDLERLEAKLVELQGQRDELAAVKTREDAANAARDFCTIARREDVRGFVLGAHAVGDPLQSVINAFVLSDPRFESWAVEQAQAVDGIELTDKAKASRLRKIRAEIAELENEQLALRKQAAMEQLEREFATASGEAA